MATLTPNPATLDDLFRVREKAELIAGRIVYFMASGEEHGNISLEIAYHLKQYVTQTGRGRAYGDNVGFALSAPVTSGRLSFSPDAAFRDIIPAGKNFKFVAGPPTFAVEVRSEGDFSPKGEREMAEKRADYFESGTLVVWDVDPVAETVARYTAADPLAPVVFRRGDVADAEPAVPGWRLPVDDIFA